MDVPASKEVPEVPISIVPDPPRVTTSVTRQWSDMNPVTLLQTVGAATFGMAVLTHPLYLVIARQQCSDSAASAAAVFKDVYNKWGVRGLFRGVGVVTTGAVFADVTYYMTVEYGKQFLPIESTPVRHFWSGVLADCITNPMYVPFAVVSQRQMTAGITTGVGGGGVAEASVAATTSSSGSFLTARETVGGILRRSGTAGLFKGMGLSLAMSPVSGVWWALYESLKVSAYSALERRSQRAASLISTSSPPALLTSTTDNAAVNGFVGGATGALLAVILNPIRVVQTRIQVLDEQQLEGGSRGFFRAGGAPSVAKGIYTRNGVRGFFKGLPVNLAIGVASGVGFGVFYEGSKQFADESGSQ